MFQRSFLMLLALIVVFLVSCAADGKPTQSKSASTVEAVTSIGIQSGYPDQVLRIATLNLAHGRKNSFNQFFLRKGTIKENLDDIVVTLIQHKPHIVALQEADASSFWSGSFDHVAYLASQAQYPWRTHAINAQTWFFSYGTAILSLLPFSETIKHTFTPSPPTLSKGFVLGQLVMLCHAGKQKCKVDVLSVHLDFLRKSVRAKQINELKEVVSARMNSTIIMGDFNSEWLAESSVIKEFETNSRFYAYRPESSAYNSYKDKRLDWILITKDLEFTDYKVVPEVLSDHSMILAEIRFKGAWKKDESNLLPADQ